MTLMLRALTILALTICAASAAAQPRDYALDFARSEVAFSASVLGAETRATVPVVRAEMVIDFTKIERSRIDVAVDVTGAQARLDWMSEAMKSAEFLDAARHPQVRLVAESFTLNTPGDVNDGATVNGNMTIRGQTRPVTLQARLFRQQGSAAGDLRNISVLVTGTLDRTRWGITAFPNALGRDISLRILARMAMVP